MIYTRVKNDLQEGGVIRKRESHDSQFELQEGGVMSDLEKAVSFACSMIRKGSTWEGFTQDQLDGFARARGWE
jgi:hypothetical protein